MPGVPSTPPIGSGGGTCSIPSGPGSPWCNGPGAASLGGGSGGGVELGGGNPINFVNGNKHQEEVDLEPMPGVLGLEFKRYYNSASRQIGLAGPAWRSSYETVLVDLGRSIQIVQADGRRLEFAPLNTADTRLCTTPDVADGQVRVERMPDGTQRYHWRWFDGRTLSFFGGGAGGGHPLQTITAPTGERSTLSFNPMGELVEVRDPAGRRLSFVYARTQAGQRPRLAAIDTPLGRVAYQHDEQGRLLRVSHAAGPGQAPHRIRRYHYEASHQAGNPWALTGVSLASQDSTGRLGTEQRLSTYGYDSRGRAVLSTRGTPLVSGDSPTTAGEMTKQAATPGASRSSGSGSGSGSGIEQITVDYVAHPAPSSGTVRGGEWIASQLGRTVVTNSVGGKTTITSAIISGHYRVMSVRGAGCAACGPTQVDYGWDAAGRLQRITHLSDTGRPRFTELLRHDAFGRLQRRGWQVHDDSGAGRPVQWQQDIIYADVRYPDGSIAVSPHASRIVRPSVVEGRQAVIEMVRDAQGQLISVSETGFSPVSPTGQQGATAISRAQTFAYQRIGGRPLLVEVDGPLPNGPRADPSDSDITRLAWDPDGNRVEAIVQPGGARWQLQHNPRTGLLQRMEAPDGRWVAPQWNADGRLDGLRSGWNGHPDVHEKRWQLDAEGRAVEEAARTGAGQPWQARWAQGFDDGGRPSWRASPLGLIDTLRFDTESRLVEAARLSASMALRTTVEHGSDGRLRRLEQPSGASWTFGYDSFGRLATRTDSLGRRLQLLTEAPHTGAHTSTGQARPPRRVASPQAWVDDFGRTVQVRSPDSGIQTRSHDAGGRLIAARDAAGNVAAYHYDAAGRITGQTVTAADTGQARTRRWRYAGEHLAAVEDPEQVERFEHDARGFRTARWVGQPVAGAGAGAGAGSGSARSSPTATTLGAVTRYWHDPAGQLTRISLPDGSTLEFVRNGQQQVTSMLRHRVSTPWLRPLLPSQPVVSDLERDAVGLAAFRSGNGLITRALRSREGVLARLTVAAAQERPILSASAKRERFLALMGIATAEAAGGGAAGEAARVPAGALPALPTPPVLPGAWGHAPDASALLDHRYLWDSQGNLLLLGQAGPRPALHAYAYDAADRLIAARRTPLATPTGGLLQTAHPATPSPAGAPAVSRWFFDADGRRPLQQENAPADDELATGTAVIGYARDSHRRLGPSASHNRHDANGMRLNDARFRYRWDPYGRLEEVSNAADGRTVARYRYNARGERIERQSGAKLTRYWHEAGHWEVETDASGRILHQTLMLAGMPVARIDSPAGKPMAEAIASERPQAWLADLRTVWAAWTGQANERWIWLHANHLGAIEAATDETAAVVWRARYAPFGRATVEADAGHPTINLRLPGQTEDPETGVHLNGHRHYDPDSGEYLSPDPLGWPDGPNPYTYVRGNPLRWVDPDGLLLFAFDGTGNDESDPRLVSNVVRFRDLYLDQHFYITGPGTRDPRSGIENPMSSGGNLVDALRSLTGKQRIDYLLNDLRKYSNQAPDRQMIDIDIVGFSRGAAEARDFANQVAADTRDGWYRYYTNGVGWRCQQINLRFMGLWDTVLSTHSGSYQLGIPATFRHVVQAVALNEYRPMFPLESIMGSAIPSGQTRIERGFLGAHSDIGGSFAEGDLARVALVWMVNQAEAAGVRMDTRDYDRTIIANPVLHDSSSNATDMNGPEPDNFGPDRSVRYLDGRRSEQRRARFDGMSYADTVPLIRWARRSTTNVVGTVDMATYLQWLNTHGYGINMRVH